MTADLPDVPEAAVEAVAGRLASLDDHKHTDWLYEQQARRVLEAALPVLVEQGWTPPDTETTE